MDDVYDRHLRPFLPRQPHQLRAIQGAEASVGDEQIDEGELDHQFEGRRSVVGGEHAMAGIAEGLGYGGQFAGVVISYDNTPPPSGAARGGSHVDPWTRR